MNGSYRDQSNKIGRLMHDFYCVDADDMHSDVLADNVRSFKETEGGSDNMCRVFENVRNEGRLEGQEETLVRQIAKNIKKGISIEDIADFLDITVDEVIGLSKKIKQ